MAKILILDDDILQLEYMKKGLASLYELGLLLDTEFLFMRLEDEKFDLILLDVYVPGEGGISLLKKLKAHPKHHHIPVVMLFSDNQLIEKCLECGATDYLSKPINQMVLKQRIENTLASVRAPPALPFSSILRE